MRHYGERRILCFQTTNRRRGHLRSQLSYVHLHHIPLSCKPCHLPKTESLKRESVSWFNPSSIRDELNQSPVSYVLFDGETAWKSNKQGHLFADAWQAMPRHGRRLCACTTGGSTTCAIGSRTPRTMPRT